MPTREHESSRPPSVASPSMPAWVNATPRALIAVAVFVAFAPWLAAGRTWEQSALMGRATPSRDEPAPLFARRQHRAGDLRVGRSVAARVSDRSKHAEDRALQPRGRGAETDHVTELLREWRELEWMRHSL